MNGRSLGLAALLSVSLWPGMAGAQDRVIDHWSGVVLNCGLAPPARWAESLCRTVIGEMRKKAEAAKVPFVAVPAFADDVALDRRAGEVGLDLTRLLHARLEISAAGAGDRAWKLTLLLRTVTPGPIGAIGSDGVYKVLVYTPMVLVDEPVQPVAMGELLADHFFTIMLKKRPN